MIFWETLVGLIALFVLSYILARVVSIGYFRTRAEYDNNQFHKFFNGDNNGK